jgi:hypothetical protein
VTRLWLEADAPGFAPAGREVVLATEPRPVQLQLEAALAEVSGVVVSGSGGGVPVAGAEVRVRTQGNGGTRTLRARTDSRGGFRIDRLAAGPVQIDVVAGGIPGVRRSVVAPARDLVLELASTVTLEGAARDRRTGAPVDRFSVQLVTGGGDPSTVSTTGRKGRFKLAVPAGTIRLRVRATGYAEVMIPVTAPAEGAVPWVDLELTRAVTLEGQVWDSRGDPGAEAQVELFTPGGEQVVTRLRSDARGRFRFDDLAEGGYLVRAAAGGEQGESSVELVAGEAPPTLVLKLSPPSTP